MTTITCYDGVNCIGGNKILLDDSGARLFFDFGRNFGAEGRFYEEFIQPKTCSGLYEHLLMGFLPPFRDLYREDLVTQLCDPWSRIEHREIGEVGGILVSHAHVDHIGSIHHLRTDIPIHCTPVTAAVSRALQDTGQSAAVAEYCYYVTRSDDQNWGVRMPDYRKAPACGRQYRLTEKPSAALDDFWALTPSSRDLEPSGFEQSSECAGLMVRSFPVDHSVFGATAWAVETRAGWVVYTGDLRLHGGYGAFTRRFAAEAARLRPAALIIEGTRITSESDSTEATVRDSCLDVVKKCRGLVIADFGPRNVERLISFLEVARATGRRLAILPRDAYLLEAMSSAGGSQEVPVLDDPRICIYWELSGTRGSWKDQLAARRPGIGVTPSEVSSNQDKFICCFSFWDINELPYIRPAPGSVWIYSSCEAFNEEMQFDMERLRNWLDHFGMEFVGGEGTEAEACFHVSGHASRPDLIKLAEEIRPKLLIPVHCEQPQLYAEMVGDCCKVVLPTAGHPVEL